MSSQEAGYHFSSFLGSFDESIWPSKLDGHAGAELTENSNPYRYIPNSLEISQYDFPHVSESQLNIQQHLFESLGFSLNDHGPSVLTNCEHQYIHVDESGQGTSSSSFKPSYTGHLDISEEFNNQLSEFPNSCPSEPGENSCDTITANENHFIDISKTGPSSQSSNESVEISPCPAGFLENITNFNYDIFLVKVLKECHHVSISDLYNLLYNDKCQEVSNEHTAPVTQANIHTFSRQRELKLCHRIVQAFNIPPSSSSCNVGNLPQPQTFVNFRTFLRKFLAMKIISDTITEAPGPITIDRSISSVSVYKGYCIICQKLMAKYPSIKYSSTIKQTILLGPAQLGKVIRLVFPELTIRLGRRGKSKYHYMGLKWNEDIVDQETLDMLELDMPSLQDTLQESRSPCGNKENRDVMGCDGVIECYGNVIV